MNLAALGDLVCQKVGKIDPASTEFCLNSLRQRHELIYDSGLWKDTVAPFDVEVAPDATHVVLPFDIARPLAVWDRDSGLPIDITSLVTVAITTPTLLTEFKGLMSFVEVESVGWPYDLGGGAQLSFDNFFNASDTPINIGGYGKATNLPLIEAQASETITATGGGGVVVSSYWGRIDRMSKPQTTDQLIVKQQGGDPLNLPQWVWPADVTEAVFARIRLISPSKETLHIGVLAKKKLRQMRLETDSPMIRGIDNALMAFTQGDMLERSRQYAKAQMAFTAATGLLQVAKDQETNQSAYEARIIPEVHEEEGVLDY